MTSSSRATSSFVLITLAMTWPLALGLASDVPGDLGDSLLNMWILGWGAEHLPRVVTGQMSLSDFWNANIFHPEPLALSFSEHLFGQVLQILPLYHLTGNLILSYNVLFLSSFVLSALGMFLLVRDLLHGESTSQSAIGWAAFMAGLIYAFVPFRIAQLAHIQSLSSQWMPIALYGFRRFLVTRNHGPLAGGSAALLMQNWSCGYYLIYFAPFVVVFVVHQIFALGRAREWRVWSAFGVAFAMVAAGTLPFVMLYLEGQRIHDTERPIGEVIRFSADVFSYFSAPEALRVWGDVMQAYPKPEGELFFGLIPLLLAVVAVVAAAGAATPTATVEEPSWRGPRRGSRTRVPLSRASTWFLISIIAIQLAGFVGILLTGGFITSLVGVPIRATNPARLLSGIAIVYLALLMVSTDARRALRTAATSPLTLATVLMVLAVWLSLGPVPQSQGRALSGLGLYALFYEHVPGFNGLRVPARYAMVAALFLSMVAGYGALAPLKRVARPAIVAVVLAAAFLIEVGFAPLLLNQTWGDSGVAPPPKVEPWKRAPAVYRTLASMADARVVTEFPFGDPAWELRWVYYSTVHWKRLVNGYSGGFPLGYKVRAAQLQRLADDPDSAWLVLRNTGTTHVIVHEAAYGSGRASEVHAWLIQHGATEIRRFDGDVLYELRTAKNEM